MDNMLVPALIIVIFVFVVYTWMTNRKTRSRTAQERLNSPEEPLQDFPYAVQDHFLSPAELSFFQVLRSVVEEHAVVCTKVSLDDVFRVKVEDKSKSRAYRNKIDRKHVDFLLCDPATMQPVLGIELDDKSHERADRQERDAFVDGVFEAAKLSLLHIPVKRAYIPTDLSTQITPYLLSTPKPVSPFPNVPPARIESPLMATENKGPRCPKCGSEMTLRTIKTGTNAGKKFWGCATYPNCRGMISIPQA